jgi:2-hydroxy-3-keto-5-methylthiopentenyl-1-phosphate phosphatase
MPGNKNKLAVGRGRNRARPIIFSDFDGTITQADVTDRILDELAAPAWREVEDEWVRGLIGSRECLERQIALVDASEQQLEDLIDSVPLDPGFAAFYRFTRKLRIPFYVVSDGFDHVIRRVLKRSGVRGPLENGSHLFASALSVEGYRLAASFPEKSCEHGCATCKAAILKRLGRGHRPVIFIGDGLSDRFAVRHADVVFAKKQLLDYCRENGIACHEFETFADVQKRLADLAPVRVKRPAKPARNIAKSRRAATAPRRN